MIVYLTLLVYLQKYSQAYLRMSGGSRISSIVMACTFAPAITPLCAIGVAIEIAFAQLWPGPPGIFDGYRSVMVGTFHETSPMSSDPPPVGPILPPSSP